MAIFFRGGRIAQKALEIKVHMPPEEIQRRWKKIDEELKGIAHGRVVDGDPATREGELLEDLDCLE